MSHGPWPPLVLLTWAMQILGADLTRTSFVRLMYDHPLSCSARQESREGEAKGTYRVGKNSCPEMSPPVPLPQAAAGILAFFQCFIFLNIWLWKISSISKSKLEEWILMSLSHTCKYYQLVAKHIPSLLPPTSCPSSTILKQISDTSFHNNYFCIYF